MCYVAHCFVIKTGLKEDEWIQRKLRHFDRLLINTRI